jgi:hypothetical protein
MDDVTRRMVSSDNAVGLFGGRIPETIGRDPA